MKIKEHIEWAVGQIFRLKSAAHNKIAWTVVVAGGALFASQWWIPLLAQIIDKVTDLNTTTMLAGWQAPDPIYGTIVIVVGMAYHLFFSIWLRHHEAKVEERRLTAEEKRSAEVKQHDKPIFDGFVALLPEDDLSYFLDTLFGDHSYRTDPSGEVSNASSYLGKVSNRFKDAELQAASDAFRAAERALTAFISVEFFVFPKAQQGYNLRLCMRPEWNIDREGDGDRDDMKKYDDLTEKLNDLIEKLNENYKALILKAKERL